MLFKKHQPKNGVQLKMVNIQQFYYPEELVYLVFTFSIPSR